eukprot:00513_2
MPSSHSRSGRQPRALSLVSLIAYRLSLILRSATHSIRSDSLPGRSSSSRTRHSASSRMESSKGEPMLYASISPLRMRSNARATSCTCTLRRVSPVPRQHLSPLSSLKMNLGMTFSGYWWGPTLFPRVMMTGRSYDLWYAFTMNSAVS